MFLTYRIRRYEIATRHHSVLVTFRDQATAALTVVFVFLICGTARSEGYKPDFDCTKPPPQNGVASMLCQNSEATKHELEFDQVYYALRQTVGPTGWKSLRQQVISDQNAMNKACGLPIPGEIDQTIPADGVSCYIASTDKLATELRGRLSGAAVQEASRDIDTHIALQQRLVALGYLPPTTKVDGVYGQDTRLAIQTWQRVSGRPTQDGLLSDEDALVLAVKTAAPGVTIPGATVPTAMPAVAPPPPPPPPPPPDDTQSTKVVTVEQAIANQEALDGTPVTVVGTVQCIDDMCSISQVNGMSSISFARTGIKPSTVEQLLKCGAFGNRCVGRLTGKLSKGIFGITLDLDRIWFRSEPIE